MRIALVSGTVTLNRCHPSFAGARLKLAEALSYEQLRQDLQPEGDTVVVWDELGAGLGSKIAVSEGREAAQPFHPERKPVDAYCAALLDHIDLGD